MNDLSWMLYLASVVTATSPVDDGSQPHGTHCRRG